MHAHENDAAMREVERRSSGSQAAPTVVAAPGLRARPPMSAGQMRGLQRMAGNRAVAAAVAAQSTVVPKAEPGVERPPVETAVEASGAVSAAKFGSPPAAPPADPVTPPVQRSFIDSIGDLASGARHAVTEQFRSLAGRIPGYRLLCVALGRDLISDAPIDRSASNLIGGFLALVPGGEQLWENLQRSGAVERVARWFDEQLPTLGISWSNISGLLHRAWDSLGVTDLADPVGAFERVANVFRPFVSRLVQFARDSAEQVMHFIFEGVMTMAGPAGAQVMSIIQRAGDTFRTILRDPIGFAGRLVDAVRGGLGQFATNILTHLRNGLFGWLTGALGGLVRLPQRFDLPGILGFILDLAGATWGALRRRLVRLLGERVVGALETAVDWVTQLATRGISAIAGRIMEFASGLVETVVGGIRDWVARSVVGAAITRLVTMFNPAGAIINAIMAAYNTIQFFIERAQQLGALASSVFDSIGAIASGSIGGAINAVEQAMARSVPVVLGFLARLLGLGDVARPVREVIGRVRGVVDQAMDRVVNWISGMARRVVGALRGGRGQAGAESREVVPGGRDGAGAMAAVVGAIRQSVGQRDARTRVESAAQQAGSAHLAGAGRIEVRGLPAVQRTAVETTLREIPEAEERRVRSSTPLNPSATRALFDYINGQMRRLLQEFARTDRAQTARGRLPELEAQFRELMREVPQTDWSQPSNLTTEQRRRALTILNEARGSGGDTRRYYDAFRDFAWADLNARLSGAQGSDPDVARLRHIIAAGGSGIHVGDGDNAIRVEATVRDAAGNVTREAVPIDFEHLVRVSDQPFRRHSDESGQNANLTPMLAEANRYFQEAIRNHGGAHEFDAFGRGAASHDDIERFILRHQLGSARSTFRASRTPTSAPSGPAPAGGYVDISDIG